MSLRIAALSVALVCTQVVVAHSTSTAIPEISTNATASSSSWSILPRAKCGWSTYCLLDDATCSDNESCSCETNECEPQDSPTTGTADSILDGVGSIIDSVTSVLAPVVSSTAAPDSTGTTVTSDPQGSTGTAVDPRSTVSVSAYDSTDCTGDAVFNQAFDDSQGECQSLTLQGTTVYGQVFCQDGQPQFNQCGSDSACLTCTSVPLMSSGVCGTGLGVYSSAKAVCQDGSGTTTATTTTQAAVSSDIPGWTDMADQLAQQAQQAIPKTGAAAAVSVSTGLVGIAAAGATLVTLML